MRMNLGQELQSINVCLVKPSLVKAAVDVKTKCTHIWRQPYSGGHLTQQMLFKVRIERSTRQIDILFLDCLQNEIIDLLSFSEKCQALGKLLSLAQQKTYRIVNQLYRIQKSQLQSISHFLKQVERDSQLLLTLQEIQPNHIETLAQLVMN